MSRARRAVAVPRTAPLFEVGVGVDGGAGVGLAAPAGVWAGIQLPASLDPALAARVALRFSSHVSLEMPDALLIELRGSIALFGGLAALSGRLRAAFAAATVALAPTPSAALAFARAGRCCGVTDPARFMSRLASLPLASLRWPEEVVLRLAAMGVRTIGEALRLPRAGFAQRFGMERLGALDRLTGRSADPRRGFVPQPRFTECCEPSCELADAAAILHGIGPLLARLERFLGQRQRGITALRLTLEHRALPATQCMLRLAAPEHGAAAFARLFALRLEQLHLPAPVRRCRLQSGPLLEPAATKAQLWQPGEQGGGGSAARMPVFLECLRARLGTAAVQCLMVVPGHRPEHMSRSVAPEVTPAASVARGPGFAPALPLARRPLWLLPVPQRLDPDADGSGHPGLQGRRLALLAGPERLETGWWDGGDIQRDYYLAAAADGARLWIYRERDAGKGEAAGHWFLHGYFG